MKTFTIFFVVFLYSTSALTVAQEPNIDLSNKFQSSVLVLSRDDLFKESNAGRAVLKIFEERQAELLLESQKIEQEFIIEEKKLTEQRIILTSEEFQILADKFDSKVEKMRKSREEKDKILQQDFINWRKKFVQIILPLVRSVMSKYNALMVLDTTNRGLIYDQKIDITKLIIKMLNKEFENNPLILDNIVLSE